MSENLKCISEITELSEYLKKLLEYKKSIIIAVASKDNIGNAISNKIADFWKDFGFFTDILPNGTIKSMYRSYIAISDAGDIVIEKLGSLYQEPEEFCDNQFYIKSTSYCYGKNEAISIRYLNKEYAVNLRGLNFVVIDKYNKEVIDTVCFDTQKADYPCFRYTPDVISMNNKDRYDWVVKELSVKLGLDKNKRQAVYWPYCNGDFYGLCASVQHAEKVYDIELIVLLSLERQNEFADWFSYDDYNVKTYELNDEEKGILFKAFYDESIYTDNPHQDLITFVQRKDKLNEMLSLQRKRFGENLRLPKFPVFNKDYYINECGIIPGKTILMVPISYYTKTLPDFFWNVCAKIFRSIGFEVIFNVSEKESVRFDGKSVYAPLSDAVGLADLCGHVFSVRTGFLDIISTTKAQVTVFTPPKCSQFDKEFKVDNSDGRIKTIEFNLNDFFLEETFIFKELYDYFNNYYRVNEEAKNIVINSVLSDNGIPLIKPDSVTKKRFSYYSYKSNAINTESLNDYSYNIRYDNKLNLIILTLSKDLSLDKFRIDINFYSDKRIKGTLFDVNNHIIVFKPDDVGAYNAEVIISSRNSDRQDVFWTEEVYCNNKQSQILRDIQNITDFSNYINALFQWSEQLIIIIAVRDTHTRMTPNPRTKVLNLMYSLGLKTNLQDTFRHSYLAIIDAGRVIEERVSSDNIISFEYAIDNHIFNVKSAGYLATESPSQDISIKVDDKEEAVNLRGLNFVIWDKRKSKVIDRVCFDILIDNNAIRRKESKVTGLVYDESKHEWCFLRNGIYDQSYTGLAVSTANGKWYYVNKGIWDRTYTGIAPNKFNSKLYYVSDGRWDESFTGEFLQDGKVYKIEKGRVL